MHDNDIKSFGDYTKFQKTQDTFSNPSSVSCWHMNQTIVASQHVQSSCQARAKRGSAFTLLMTCVIYMRKFGEIPTLYHHTSHWSRHSAQLHHASRHQHIRSIHVLLERVISHVADQVVGNDPYRLRHSRSLQLNYEKLLETGGTRL